MIPGETELTLISGASSLAAPLVNVSTAPFAAAYNVVLGPPSLDAIEVKFTILGESDFFNSGRAREVTLNS